MFRRIAATAAIALATPLALAQNILTVDDDGLELPSAQFSTLQEALAAAQDGDVIELYPGSYQPPGTLSVTQANLTIRGVNPDDPTVVGPTRILPPGPVLASFQVNADGFTLSGVTLDGSGGGISLNSGASVTLDRCVVRDHDLSGSSAVQIGTGRSIVTGCTFRNNNSGFGGGAVAFTGGASSSLTIENCLFENNTASPNGLGGALQAFGTGDLTVADTTFRTNTAGASQFATSQGGACYLEDTVGGLSRWVFERCKFEGNRAASSGSAIYAARGDLVLAGCSFTGNGGPVPNSPSAGGSVLDTISCRVVVEECDFMRNRSGRTAAVWTDFDSDAAWYTTRFHQNAAGDDGAFIPPSGTVVSKSGGAMGFAGCSFYANRVNSLATAGLGPAERAGASVAADGSTALFVNSVYGGGGTPFLQDCQWVRAGSGSDVRMTNCSYYSRSGLDNEPGAIVVTLGGFFANPSDVTISNTSAVAEVSNLTRSQASSLDKVWAAQADPSFANGLGTLSGSNNACSVVRTDRTNWFAGETTESVDQLSVDVNRDVESWARFYGAGLDDGWGDDPGAGGADQSANDQEPDYRAREEIAYLIDRGFDPAYTDINIAFALFFGFVPQLRPELNYDGTRDFYVDPRNVDGNSSFRAATIDIGAVEFQGPEGCSPADLVPPFGVISQADVAAFVDLFFAGDPFVAGLAVPFDVVSQLDVAAFVDLFFAGCPAR
ncbi:MAG: right-handed parallel beta-helix repeat-containing protein [Planctomycetota bacterium]